MSDLLRPRLRRRASGRLGVASGASKRPKFAGGQLSPFAHREPLQLEGSHLDSTKLPHRMADPIHHASNLTVPTFSKGDEQTSPLPIAAKHDEVAFRGPDRFPGATVDQVETATDLVENVVLDASLHGDVVPLVNPVARMGQSVGEIAVVGEQQQTRALEIETTHAEEPALRRMIDEIEGELPSLGILGRAHVALGLEQHDVVVSTPFLDPATVYSDVIGLRVHEAREALDDRAVHRDRTVLDECFGGSTRCDPRVGQDLLDPDSFALPTF